MNQRQLIWLLSLLVICVLAGGVSAQSEGEPGALRNPLNPYGGADPWLTYYDGNYYLAATTWASEWTMRKSPTLAGLKTAEPVVIYRETDPSRCCNFWAPEFRLFEGDDGQQHWYFYYSAGTAGTYDFQHPHVLESEGTDPLGPYHYKSSLLDPEDDSWAIDGSVLDLDGSLYFLFSAFTDGPQSIYIAPMSNPWTVSGERVLISKPTLAWESSGNPVNEGPVALQHDGKTFVVFSASACTTPDYKLGMVTLVGDDPLDSASWVKNPEPVFQRSDANGVYGPGHNGFFQSPDGTRRLDRLSRGRFPAGRLRWSPDDARPEIHVECRRHTQFWRPGLDRHRDRCAVGRYGRRSAAGIRRAGTDALPVVPLQQLRTCGTPTLSPASIRRPNPLADSQFIVTPGLADGAAVSLQVVQFPRLLPASSE